MIVLMYVARIPKTSTQPTSSDTTDASVIVKKTLLNITTLPLCVIEGLCILLRASYSSATTAGPLPTEHGLLWV